MTSCTTKRWRVEGFITDETRAKLLGFRQPPAGLMAAISVNSTSCEVLEIHHYGRLHISIPKVAILVDYTSLECAGLEY